MTSMSVTSTSGHSKTVRALVKGYLMNRGVPAEILSLKESVFEMLGSRNLGKNSGKSEGFFWNEIRREALFPPLKGMRWKPLGEQVYFQE